MSKMTKEERELYHSDVKAKSDWNAGIRYAEKKAKEEGKEEGKLEEKIEIAKSLKDEGLSIELISKTTGLPIEEIEKL
ncbi:hypothetical protein [Pedobacter heparinus]|uniref:hypothetical protein n=1 Tax=Pedobacter heparinus TaxID=984 RepID=UPI00292EAC59|nr:hypothetical protein [Pedobacter heparinus]